MHANARAGLPRYMLSIATSAPELAHAYAWDGARAHAPCHGAHIRARAQVPFEEVLDLVRNRRVYVHKGEAYVHSPDLISLVLGHFRARLSRALLEHQRAWYAIRRHVQHTYGTQHATMQDATSVHRATSQRTRPLLELQQCRLHRSSGEHPHLWRQPICAACGPVCVALGREGVFRAAPPEVPCEQCVGGTNGL